MNILKSLLTLVQSNNDTGGQVGSKEEAKEKPALYYSYYLFGHSGAKPIWEWGNWQQCMNLLQPIINLCPEVLTIKSTQTIPVVYDTNGQFTSHDKGALTFGKMTWDLKNNEKWTTKYADQVNWHFFDTEISFPSRSFCHKSRKKPDLLIIVYNENINKTVGSFIDQSITIHIDKELMKEGKEKEVDQLVNRIGELLHWKIAGKMVRPVAFLSEMGMGFTDSIWDGPNGVLTLDDKDFSENYQRYGIERIFPAAARV